MRAEARQLGGMTKPPDPPADASPASPGRLSVTVPPNLHLAVQLAAEAQAVPVSGFVRRALREKIARDARPTLPRGRDR